MRKIGLMIVAFFAPIAIMAQLSGSQIDAIRKTAVENFPADGPGGTILIAKDGKILFHEAFGLANVELNVPMSTEHIFRIGSITKQFTAIAILQLVEKKQLNLQDDLTKFIPDYPTGGKKITIEQLLNHTSGIKSYTSMDKWDEEARRKDFTVTELIDYFKNEPMDFEPGEKWLYNNSGYILLGHIIEKISGKTYAEVIEENVLKPMGMTSSSYDVSRKIIKNRIPGYDPSRTGTTNASYLSMTQPYAAGSLLSTTADLFKWNQAVFSGKLVSLELLKKAHTSGKLNDGSETNYGYGWQFKNIQGVPTIEHGGGINGFLSDGIYLPSEKIYIAVLSNCTCNSATYLSTQVAGLTLGKPFDVSADPTLKSDDKLVGIYEGKDKVEIKIKSENNELKFQSTGGGWLNIIPIAKDEYKLSNSFSRFSVKRNSAGESEGIIFRSRSDWNQSFVKTKNQLDEVKEIVVADHILQTYVGYYEFNPSFGIEVFKEGNQLKAQATGQQPFEIFPTSHTEFFLKVVDAKVVFTVDEKGLTTQLTLLQGGRELPMKKVK